VQFKQKSLIDSEGNARSGIRWQVVDSATATPVAIFDHAGAPIANDASDTTDSLGRYAFATANNTVDITFPDLPVTEWIRGEIFYDPADAGAAPLTPDAIGAQIYPRTQPEDDQSAVVANIDRPEWDVLRFIPRSKWAQILDGSITADDLQCYIQDAWDAMGAAGGPGFCFFPGSRSARYTTQRPLYAVSGLRLVGRGALLINEAVTNAEQNSQCIKLGNCGAQDINDDWPADKDVAEGFRCKNGGNNYRCSQAGRTAVSGGPAGTGSGIVDGTAQWDYVSPVANFGTSAWTAAYGFDCDAHTAGNMWIQFKSIPDAQEFAVGDVVTIRGSEELSTTSGYFSPRYNEMNVVTEVDSVLGRIRLRRGLRQDYSDPMTVHRLDGNSKPGTQDYQWVGQNGKTYGGRGVYAVRDFVIDGLRCGNTHASWGCLSLGGEVDCDIDVESEQANSIAALNLAAHSRFKIRGHYGKRAFECAQGSHDLEVRVHADWVDNGKTDAAISIQSTSDNVYVHIDHLDHGPMSSRAVTVSGASSGCMLTGKTINAPNVTASVIALGSNSGNFDPTFCTIRDLEVRTGVAANFGLEVLGKGASITGHHIEGFRAKGEAGTADVRINDDVRGCVLLDLQCEGLVQAQSEAFSTNRVSGRSQTGRDLPHVETVSDTILDDADAADFVEIPGLQIPAGYLGDSERHRITVNMLAETLPGDAADGVRTAEIVIRDASGERVLVTESLAATVTGYIALEAQLRIDSGTVRTYSVSDRDGVFSSRWDKTGAIDFAEPVEIFGRMTIPASGANKIRNYGLSVVPSSQISERV